MISGGIDSVKLNKAKTDLCSNTRGGTSPINDSIKKKQSRQACEQQVADFYTDERLKPLLDKIAYGCFRDEWADVAIDTAKFVGDILAQKDSFKEAEINPGGARGNAGERRKIELDGKTLAQAKQEILNPPSPPPPPEPEDQPEVAAAEVAFEADGSRKVEPFAPKETTGKPKIGKFSLDSQVVPASDPGFTTTAKGTLHLVQDPRFALSLNGDLTAGRTHKSVDHIPHFLTSTVGPASTKLRQEYHLYLQGKIGLNGTLTGEVPEINVIAANNVATNLEKVMTERWGEKAARHLLDNVTGPHMAKDELTIEKTWESYVWTASIDFEKFLKQKKLKVADLNIGNFAWHYRYQPLALIDLLALWSGKKPKEIHDGLKDKGIDFEALAKGVKDNHKDRKEKFNKLFKAAEALDLNRQYELPENFDDKPDPAQVPFSTAIDLGYMTYLQEQEAKVAKALGVSKDDLRKMASDANVKYPFDPANDPENPWAAQKMWEDFKTVLKKKEKYGEKASAVLSLDAGIVDWFNEAPGLGLKPSVALQLHDSFALSVGGYLGIARLQPYGEDKVDSSAAVALNGGVEWQPLVTFGVSAPWLKEWKLAAETSWSDASTAPEILAIAPSTSAAFALSENVKLTPYFEVGWGIPLEEGATNFELKPAVALEKAKLFDDKSTLTLKASYTRATSRFNVASKDVETPGSTLDGSATDGTSTFNGINETRGDGRHELKVGPGLSYKTDDVVVRGVIDFLYAVDEEHLGNEHGSEDPTSRTRKEVMLKIGLDF